MFGMCNGALSARNGRPPPWNSPNRSKGSSIFMSSSYVPGFDRIIVSSQSGKLRFYDAETYALVSMHQAP